MQWHVDHFSYGTVIFRTTLIAFFTCVSRVTLSQSPANASLGSTVQCVGDTLQSRTCLLENVYLDRETRIVHGFGEWVAQAGLPQPPTAEPWLQMGRYARTFQVNS